MVLVGPRQKMVPSSQTKNSGLRTNRRQYSWDTRAEPAVDLPLQFNFGSPYSSSLIVFFDFEQDATEKKASVNIYDKRNV